MPENYKHLYHQMKKMVEKYQDEIVPGLRKTIEDMEKNRVEVVRCRECEFCGYNSSNESYKCRSMRGMHRTVFPEEFCSWGERKEYGT